MIGVGLRLIMLMSCGQTWKKLQAVQAALADILSKITLFWGHFELKTPHFLLKIEEEVLNMEDWGSIKEKWGCMMENWGLRIQKWGWRVVDWGKTIKIWGFYHATPTFNTNNFGLPLSQITLFWGHFKTLNLPLEDILQIFPGLIWAVTDPILTKL